MHLKKVVAMNIHSTTDNLKFANMTKLQKWQHFLRRKFQETENSYYPIMDEFTQKLADLEIHTRTGILKMPDFDIHQFSFIKDWQIGQKSSKEVYSILKTMNVSEVAETSLTRRLDHYRANNKTQVIADYIEPVKALILKNSVPLYSSYLNMLVRYFAKLVEADMMQEKVTWIEQLHDSNAKISKKIQDMTINQVVRQLEHQVIPFNNRKYSVGKNLICLDEEMTHGAHAVHWIFAPQVYIDELKKEFKIVDVMSIDQETDYIKSLIGTYINEKV